jgi:UDP-N-acetylmuramoylalanine--D-glutamate ligase
MKHPREYAGQQVVVLGLARSGRACARLFHELGARVIVNDRKDRSECPEADELESLGIQVICGYHPDDLMHEGIHLVVKNPGIPYSAPPLRRAMELDLEIVTEVEVAWHMTDKPIIGITGSNGKTTTTTWIYEMLRAAGMKPVACGNIGRAMCEVIVEEREPYHWLVSELSSFQLKGTVHFRPHIACLLNISETHLDYHGSMEDYIESKAKLFAHQTASDKAVLNYDDEVCRRLVGRIRADVTFFSAASRLERGVYVDGGDIVFRDGDGELHRLLPVSELGIPGSYNVENALAATAAAIGAGVPLDAIARVLASFRGVEHRLEYVAERGGVRYYNNSKATNASAAIKALEAIDARIVLIAGGLDRGATYEELVPVLRERVKALVLLGETREKLKRAGEQAGLDAIEVVEGESPEAVIREAVRRASALARPGDVVMLNPACASWDMFSSYEERGRMFKESVHNLE